VTVVPRKYVDSVGTLVISWHPQPSLIYQVFLVTLVWFTLESIEKTRKNDSLPTVSFPFSDSNSKRPRRITGNTRL